MLHICHIALQREYIFSRMSKTLRKGEIREILDESEDGLDFDDDDDVDDPNYNEELVHADFDEVVENILEDIENENMELCADPSNDVPPILAERAQQKKCYNDILWKKKEFSFGRAPIAFYRQYIIAR